MLPLTQKVSLVIKDGTSSNANITQEFRIVPFFLNDDYLANLRQAEQESGASGAELINDNNCTVITGEISGDSFLLWNVGRGCMDV